ncbi:MAG: hypothetical protein JW753_08225 [Dehalococcoidia bacterium]|nr:hypothetical protein [Dehalococcoidia bacterium]
MSQYWQWIEHKGKRILLAKFGGLRDEKTYVEAIADLEQEILRQPKGQLIPLALDVSDTRVTRAVTNRGKQLMETAKANGIPDSPTALIGLSGTQKAIVMAIQLVRGDIHVVGSLDEAKDWLVSRLG